MFKKLQQNCNYALLVKLETRNKKIAHKQSYFFQDLDTNIQLGILILFRSLQRPNPQRLKAEPQRGRKKHFVHLESIKKF